MLHLCFRKGVFQQSMMTHPQTQPSPDSSTSKRQNRRKNSIIPLQPGPRHVAAEGMEVTSCGRCWLGSLLLEVMGCNVLILIRILGYKKVTTLLKRWTWIALYFFSALCFHLQLFGRMIYFFPDDLLRFSNLTSLNRFRPLGNDCPIEDGGISFGQQKKNLLTALEEG